MTRLLTLLWMLLVATPVAAEEEAPEAPAAEAEAPLADEATLEDHFNTYVNGPMVAWLFYDLIFWDNTLPMGEGIGQEVEGGTIVGFEDGAYKVAAQLEAPLEGARVIPEESAEIQVNGFTMKLRADGPSVMATTSGGPINLSGFTTVTGDEASKLNVAPSQLPEGFDMETQADQLVGVTDALPFSALALLDDQGSATLLPVTGTLPPDYLKPTVGDTVWIDGELGEVLSMGEGTLSLQSSETTEHKEPLPNSKGLALPFIVAWLVAGALFFTLRMGFINIRAFKHAIDVTMGKFDNPDDPGEISHFQALSSALSATVGLGNIAGVAVAVGTGGPGAVFWMVAAGFLGMSSKFVECTLGQMYRVVDDQGQVSGGPMRYLGAGLAEMGLGWLGKGLAVLFALMCIGGSLGGGNMFQANQSYAAVADRIPLFANESYGAPLYGIILAFFVGLVILGGIKSIGKVAGLIVPAMCGIYVLAGLAILGTHAGEVPAAFMTIITEAFNTEAAAGGILGVLVIGFQRAAFSNEAGIGSAAIAHSAASTDEPVREGVVALLEPFIDTLIVCSMTGLVVVITGAYETHAGDGVLMTSAAFGSVFSWFPMVLSLAVVLFAFSTMISWSYYGERCWTFLLGGFVNDDNRRVISSAYKLMFLVFVVAGSVWQLDVVLTFSDLMVLGMAFPNILGVVLLSGRVKKALDDYWGRYTSGAMKRTK